MESLSKEERLHFDDLRAKYGKDLALRLCKALYGLKQSSREWNQALHVFLVDNAGLNFQQSSFDPCLYFKYDADGCLVLLLVYVDDTLIVARHPTNVADIKRRIAEKFKIRDLGPVE